VLVVSPNLDYARQVGEAMQGFEPSSGFMIFAKLIKPKFGRQRFSGGRFGWRV